MSLAVNDVVEVYLGGSRADAAPRISVLGVVAEGHTGSHSKTVRVLIGASVHGVQIVEVADVRRVASGASMPWSGTDTHAMIKASTHRPNSSRPPLARTNVVPPTTSDPVNPSPAHTPTLATPTPSRSDVTPAPQRASENEEDCLGTLCSSRSSELLTSDADGSEAAAEEEAACVGGSNVLYTACIVADTLLCGPNLRVSSASFALLTVWIMVCAVHPVTVGLAAVKLVVAVLGLLLCASVPPLLVEAADVGEAFPAPLLRLALVCTIVGGANRGLVMTGPVMAVLLLSCARAFDKRERHLGG